MSDSEIRVLKKKKSKEIKSVRCYLGRVAKKTSEKMASAKTYGERE